MLKKTILLYLTLTQINTDCGTLSDTNCNGCLLPETCSQCYNTFWDSTEKKCTTPSTKIPNCYKYKNTNTCESCNLGYYLKSSTSCEPIKVANCEYSEKSDECLVCKNAMRPAADLKSCSETSCKTENCDLCMLNGGIEICFYCKKGFASNASGTTCLADEGDCHMKNGVGEGGDCVRCKQGYFMSKGDCEESDVIPKTDLDESDGEFGFFVFFSGFFVMFM